MGKDLLNSQTSNGHRLNYTRTFCMGLAFMGISAFWQLYDNIIPLILKNRFALEETLTGVIMAADNLVAVLLLPILGAWSDRVNTRFGKRIPFITVGTLLSVFFMMWVPVADQSHRFGLFILSLAAVLLSMGLYRSPAVALMPDLTPPKFRSQGNAVINVMGALGAMFALIMIQVLVDEGLRPDYTRLFLSVGVLMLVCLGILLLTINEKKIAEKVSKEWPEYENEIKNENQGIMDSKVKRSMIFGLLTVFFYYMAFNGVTTAYSRYAQEVWNLTGGGFAASLFVIAATAFVSYIPLGVLATKIGRKKSIGIGFFMMFLSFIVLTFVHTYHWYINFWFVFVGIGGSAVGVNIFPVIVDMCSNSELGKYTGLYYTFSMSAQIVTPILSGFFMEYLSYRTLFPYAAVCSVIGILVAIQVHHGDTKPLQTGSVLDYLDN